MKLEHYFLYRDVDVDIKKVDKIEITDVDCYEGPNDTLIITKIIILNSMNYYQYWKNIMEEAGVQVI